MHQPQLFRSFLQGGFECSSHRRQDGLRLDLIRATRHDIQAQADYTVLHQHGLQTVRDGLRWHLIEQQAGRYDFSSFLPMVEASERVGAQVIWDLCHYGWPDDIDIWRPAFVERFARFAAAVAKLLRDRSDEVPFYCVLNEVSYWAWAGGDQAIMNPLSRGRGLELKHQLIRAVIAATRAVREIDPRARFVHIDPLIHVTPSSPEFEEEAQAYGRAQYDSWLLLSGELWPGLGGAPSLLDIVGINHYSNNQWVVGGDEHGRTLLRGDAAYKPLRTLLEESQARLKRPILIAETGAEGENRGPWMRYVLEEAEAALSAGVALEGVCLYPVLDYPGWANDRYCATGLYGFPDDAGIRPLHAELAQVVAHWRRRHASAA
jgi:hypothetical protein